MSEAKHWKDLVAWQKGHELVLFVYRLTAAFPKNEKYVLADQIKRAAISIPANLKDILVIQSRIF